VGTPLCLQAQRAESKQLTPFNAQQDLFRRTDLPPPCRTKVMEQSPLMVRLKGAGQKLKTTKVLLIVPADGKGRPFAIRIQTNLKETL
jgi:hypothetical protein